MPEYTLRNVDPHLWSQFTTRANQEQWPVRSLIVALMQAYAAGDYRPPQPPPRELPEFAWLRAHYREVAKDPEFANLHTQAQWDRVFKHVLHSDAGLQWRALDSLSAVQRVEIVKWLEQTSNVQPAASLSLRAIAHVGEGSDLQTNRRAFQYEVLGLPPWQQAWIADFNGGWRVLRTLNGKQGDWSPPYLTKEDALNTLAEVVGDVLVRQPGLCQGCGETLNTPRPTTSVWTNSPDGEHVVEQHWHLNCRSGYEAAKRAD